MENEFGIPRRSEATKESLEIEYKTLLDMASDEYRKQLRAVGEWFSEEVDKALKAVEEGKAHLTSHEIVNIHKKKINKINSEYINTVEKIKQDILERMQDANSDKRVRELLDEITKEEWKKWFEDGDNFLL